MGCPKEVIIGDDLVFSICTHNPDTSELADADSLPTYRMYEDETASPVATGEMAKLDDANTLGFYTEKILGAVTAAFLNGKTYTLYIEAIVNGSKGGITFGFKAKSG